MVGEKGELARETNLNSINSFSPDGKFIFLFVSSNHEDFLTEC